MIGPLRENVGVTIDTNRVGPFLESKIDSVRAALVARMDWWSARLQQIVVNDKLQGQVLKHRTGKLGDSVRALPTEVSGDFIHGGAVAGGGPVDYARPLEYGSQAHDIVPVNARALRFVIDGKVIFAQRVHHPGTRAFAYMRGTLDENASAYVSDMQEAANEGAKG